MTTTIFLLHFKKNNNNFFILQSTYFYNNEKYTVEDYIRKQHPAGRSILNLFPISKSNLNRNIGYFKID